MRIFALSEQRAIDIALDFRHAYKEENLTIVDSVKAPDDYHEGIASLRLHAENFNDLMNRIKGLDPEPYDKTDLGWYGGSKQQPKVGDPHWDRE